MSAVEKNVAPMSKLDPSAVEDATHAEKSRDLRVTVTPADNKRIRNRTDLFILTCLVQTYFLQIADKTIIGLTAVYGLREDTNLTGAQYSNLGAIGYYAQLGAQPIAAYTSGRITTIDVLLIITGVLLSLSLIVRLRYRVFVPAIVVLWSISLLGMAGSRNYGGLMACRFLLGWWEAAAIPCYSVVTISFWRRSEQPLRVAAWYGTNGLANLISSPIVYGAARASSSLDTYQIVYLIFGLWSVVVGLASYWWLSDSPGTARFLSPEDRLKAVERLKANNQGIVSHKFNIKQVVEAFLDLKLWLFIVMTFCVNAGASASNVFGPIILQKLIGFSADRAVLLNMPFGALQTIVILASSWAAVRFKHKAPVSLFMCLPTIAGAAILYAVPKTPSNQGTLLAGYYMFGFIWMGANLGGQTKKATCYTTFNAASAVGNIVAPYLFKAKDAPNYKPAMEGMLVLYVILALAIVLQAFNLIWAQKRKEKSRVAMGLPAKIVDHSMDVHFKTAEDPDETHREHGEEGFDDRTDRQNPYFTYVW